MTEQELYHYGTPRHSGRYPWGSGEDPYQHNGSFLTRVDELKEKGLSEKQIADSLGMSTTELRQQKSIAKAEKRAADVALAIKLKDSGMSVSAIGRQMGINESSVRSLLDASTNERAKITENTADVLKKSVDSKGYIDVGVGTEAYLNVSRTKMQTAVKKLEDEGYVTYNIQVEQLGSPGNKTTIKVLAPPGTTYKDIVSDPGKIKLPVDYATNDGGRTFFGIESPQSISSDRIKIRYAEDGGTDKDGVIEIRRGVQDLSLGNANYAQVRIAVDGTHYLKGMAMYSDDLPKGVDIVFNTNKHTGTDKMDVLKKLKDDPDNPFGATIKANGQSHYVDKDGKTKLSAINKVNEEGDWDRWGKTLSTQVLSKQDPALAKRQLDISYAKKKNEYDEISSLTNPAVKKRLLNSFADDCDASSVHLKAAGLPRQRFQVILPIPSLRETEVYAPNFKNGESVVLIRYPHGGTFEIPELTVNNRQSKAKSILGQAKDAIGINPKVAARLSGADFDGDTVLVIPTSTTKIKTSSPLKELQNFDPKESYPYYEGMKVISPKTKQIEMGKVSNLITDMTIKGAKQEEIARAVRHSMVVIDSEKHKLNYKQSYIDNGIEELKVKYQSKDDGSVGGASTLISKASSEARVAERKQGATTIDPVTGKSKRVYVDPETGKKLYRDTGSSYTKTTTTKSGKTVTKEVARTTKTTKMAEVDDAYELSSGTRIENTYASYANKLKSLANQSRKEALSTPNVTYSPSAKEAYSKEVASLNAKLNVAIKNKPLERQAQAIANSVVSAKKASNPSMDNDELKKVKSQALAEARTRTGASKKDSSIQISDKEWEAIQAGAITNSKLVQILDNTDIDRVKELATPKSSNTLSAAKESRIKSLYARGYTQAEIADALGVSVSTVNKVV